eukprot:gb/GECG01008222.1/.p1 GENE.gb/GECG01008222.1/~~gb/GECG01008222.1/.p1  ORF type:complete len:350 (+),score=70.57 gb/GECG01008222.1/:1-1050(+)
MSSSSSRNEEYERNVGLLLQDIDTSDLFFAEGETKNSSSSSNTAVHEESSRNLSTNSTSCTFTSATTNGISSSSSEAVGSLLRTAVHPLDLRYRPIPGGKQVAYVANDIVISKANEIFGYNGWKCEIKGIFTDFSEQNKNGAWNIGISAHMRVTLSDGAFHEDIGWGACENVRNREKAIEKAKKQAITDARKRCLRLFGDALGNCVRNEDYQKEVFQTNRQQRQQHGSVPTVQRFTSEELLGAPTAHPSSGYNSYESQKPPPSETPAAPTASSNAPLRDSSNYRTNSTDDANGTTSINESASPPRKEISEEEKKEMIRKRRELAKQRLEERKKQAEATSPQEQKRARVS